ncbi:MAG: SDR family oxidoreductase [Reichenbachiella sp.]
MRKTVIITGGSSGIGSACAVLYAQKGYNVVFTGRDKTRFSDTEEKLEAINGQYLGIEADSIEEAGAKYVVDQAIEKFGSVDVLICNAGVSMKAFFEDLDLKVFEDVIKVNLIGTINYVKHALPHLLKSKGSIVGVSSINGHRGTPGRTAYSASKFAMEGFFESLRIEVKKRGVNIFMISPGYTDTNIRNTALSANGESVGESFRDEKKAMSAEKVAGYIYRGQQRGQRDLILTPLGWWLTFFNKWIPKIMDRTVYNVMHKEDPSLFKD